MSMERERERNVSYEIYQASLKFRTKRLESLEQSKILAKSEEVKPMWNGHGYTWYLIRSEMGFDNLGVSMFIEEVAPHKSNVMHRHFSEATVYILSGKGHTVLDEDTLEWKAGDAVFVPPMRWHQFFNDGDETVRYIGMGSERVMRSVGLYLVQDVTQVSPEEKPHFGKRASISVSTSPTEAGPREVKAEAGSQGVYEDDRASEKALIDKRLKSKVVAKGSDVNPRWDGHSWTHYMVDPRLGYNAYIYQIFIEDIPPNKSTAEHRHLYEEAVYVLEGKGHTIMNGKRYDWKAGDAMFIPPFWWHQHFNDDPNNRSRWLVQSNALLIRSLGYAPIEHRE
ncbi:MAG: cupin domain-containing protein [Thaumarchaeota archaeon]|nr:cupin domain-containing protein [Nitrososphaerota archaeon]